MGLRRWEEWFKPNEQQRSSDPILNGQYSLGWEAGEVEIASDSLGQEGAVVPDAQPCCLLVVGEKGCGRSL